MIRFLYSIITFFLAVVGSAAITRTPSPLLYEQYKNLPIEQLNRKGLDFFLNQQSDSAAILLTLVVQQDTARLDQETRIMMAKARNVLGIISFNHSNYPTAYSHFLKSIQLNDVPDAPGYISLASVFLHYGDMLRAFDYLKSYTRYASSNAHYNEACLGIANILSTNFARAGVPTDSIGSVVEQFLALPQEVKKANSYPLAYRLARGWVEGHNHRHVEAVAEIKTALTELDSVIMPRTRHALYLVMADQYMHAAQKDSAMAYIHRAENLALANDFKDLLSTTYSDASLIYSTFGDSIGSDLYRRRMLEINDTLFNPKELGKLHDLNMFYEVDKFERRIEIMAVRERMRLTVLWTVGIALCVVIILLLMLFRQNRDLRKKNRTLFERNVSEMESEKRRAYKRRKNGSSHNDVVASEDHIPKYNTSSISDTTREKVLRRIQEVFEDETIFCQEGFSLNDLATLCESNSRYVSQVINEDMSSTFAQLLNNERVKIARQRLIDTEHYGHLTIEAIISDLGCKSRSTFSKTFKRITGLSPSEFQRMARTMPSSLPKEEI